MTVVMTVRLDIEPLNGEMNNIFIYYVIVKVRKAAKRNALNDCIILLSPVSTDLLILF